MTEAIDQDEDWISPAAEDYPPAPGEPKTMVITRSGFSCQRCGERFAVDVDTAWVYRDGAGWWRFHPECSPWPGPTSVPEPKSEPTSAVRDGVAELVEEA